MKYRIYDLSVRAMLNYSKPDGLFYKTVIDKNALRSCLKHSAHEQDDNALFYQILCVLHGNDFKYDGADLVTDLSDVIFYADSLQEFLTATLPIRFMNSSSTRLSHCSQAEACK